MVANITLSTGCCRRVIIAIGYRLTKSQGRSDQENEYKAKLLIETAKKLIEKVY